MLIEMAAGSVRKPGEKGELEWRKVVLLELEAPFSKCSGSGNGVLEEDELDELDELQYPRLTQPMFSKEVTKQVGAYFAENQSVRVQKLGVRH